MRIRNKKVLVRVDWNVPMTKGKIDDTYRIDQTLPTLEYLLKNNNDVYVITHLTDQESNFEVLVNYVNKKLPEGNIFFLPNLRNDDREEKNNLIFAKELVKDKDLFINDAFAVCHRKHASVVSVPKLIPSYPGLLLKQEIKELSKAFKPKKPFTLILGGAKFGTKLPLVKEMLNTADHIFIGGALANAFFKEQGYEIGQSLVDQKVKGLKNILSKKNIILPIDVVVKDKNGKTVKEPNLVNKDEIIVDIGPKTIKMMSGVLKKSKLIIWNGPMGNFEQGFIKGTNDLALLVANSSGYSIVGGGDTLYALKKFVKANKFNFVSTGGGAMLEFLVSKSLPGIDVLGKKQ